MLNESTVSIIMSGIQESLTDKLKREGFIFPSLILMNEDKHIRIDDFIGAYPCILNAEYLTDINDTKVTVVTLRNRDEKDDINIEDFIREVTLRHQADATGYFSQCLYKPMKKKEYDSLTTDAMNKDPDTIRVLHNCFFVKGASEKGFVMVTPYIVKEGANDENEFVFDDVPQNEVIALNKCWEVPSYALETRITNPYL